METLKMASSELSAALPQPSFHPARSAFPDNSRLNLPNRQGLPDPPVRIRKRCSAVGVHLTEVSGRPRNMLRAAQPFIQTENPKSEDDQDWNRQHERIPPRKRNNPHHLSPIASMANISVFSCCSLR